MFTAVIVHVSGSSYYQPFNTCCDLGYIRSSLGDDYEIVDIFYNEGIL